MFAWWRRRRLLATSPLLMDDTADGTMVQVTGRVRALEHVLYAPASGRPAVIYRIAARDMAPSEPGGLQGSTAFESVDACPFVLESDSGGAVQVICDFAVLVSFSSRRVPTASGHWAAYSQRTGLRARTAHETVIQHGQRVRLVGVLERRPVAPGAEAGFREAPVELTLVGDFDRPLLVAPAR